jgi:hypothetical protein
MTNIVNGSSNTSLLATLTSAATNVTGDGTVYTLVWNNVVYGSGYNTSTGVFTCPVAGDYLFTPVVQISNLTASFTFCTATLVATGGSFQTCEFRIGNYRNPSNSTTLTPCVVPVRMAVNDTAQWNILISGSTKTLSFDTLSTLSIVRLP